MSSSRIPPQVRETVRRYALEHDLLRPGPVVVAVSGGVDSAALLLILADLAEEIGLVLHVAHFDHRARRGGAEDAQFVADLAVRVGATVRIGRADRAPIATGHTQDDQAETVLLHLARGSGIAGLAAMRPSREGVVRPLLAIGRADTIVVCAAAGIVPREDPTNRSLRYARNRIRKKVMPELAAINPQASAALARLADAAADVAGSHERRAGELLASATRDGAIDLDALGPDAALRVEALALAWQRATGHVLTARHRAAVADQAAQEHGRAALDLPGGRLLRDKRELRIEARTTS